MDVTALHCVLQYSRARLADRLVLFVIVSHLDWRDVRKPAWPSVRTIAQEAGLSERQVRASIAKLEAMGELEIERSAGMHGVNRYRLGPCLTIANDALFQRACVWPPVQCAAARRAGVRVRKGPGRECDICVKHKRDEAVDVSPPTPASAGVQTLQGAVNDVNSPCQRGEQPPCKVFGGMKNLQGGAKYCNPFG